MIWSDLIDAGYIARRKRENDQRPKAKYSRRMPRPMPRGYVTNATWRQAIELRRIKQLEERRAK